jgi:hypothetical protein
MKTLYESILSSTKAGGIQLTNKNIGQLFPKTELTFYFDTDKMWEDVKKMTGKKPSYFSEAFAQILISKPILKRYYDLFFDENMNPHEKNQKVTEAIVDIFKDYIRSPKEIKDIFKDRFRDSKCNFYCHRSNIYKGFELGVHYKSEFSFGNRPTSENILILKK